MGEGENRKARLLEALAETLDVGKALALVHDADEEELREALREAARQSLPPQAARIYVDGASRGNPGPAGAGAVILGAEGTTIASVTKYLGEFTNNVAEYLALSLGLKEALRLGIRRVEIFSDSELLVKQINGEYRVKNNDLKVLNRSVRDLLGNFEDHTIAHIRRDENREADRLANIAIDER